jgi:hypothetical protein
MTRVTSEFGHRTDVLPYIPDRDIGPAKALRPPPGHLGRETVPGIPHFIFPCGPSPLPPPFLKRPRCAPTRTPARPVRIVRGRRRMSPPFRCAVRRDRSRSSIPMGWCRVGCGRARRWCRLGHRHNRRASSQRVRDIDGGLARAWRYSSAGRGVRQWPARPWVVAGITVATDIAGMGGALGRGVYRAHIRLTRQREIEPRF